jgi:hypothetical protein
VCRYKFKSKVKNARLASGDGRYKFKDNVKDKRAGGAPALQLRKQRQQLRFVAQLIFPHLVIVAGHRRAAFANQEVEIGAQIRLLHVLGIELYVAASWVRRRSPLRTAGG